ncbi:MAG: tetratricopeptide repeat protein, partial [Ignavibacteriaceae bacterium]
MLWKIIIVLSAAVASYFIPTPQELRNAFVSGQNFYASSNFDKAIKQYDLIIDTESDFLKEDSVKVELLSGELNVSVVVAAYYQKANALKNLEKKNEAIKIFRIVENRHDEKKLAALAQFQIYDIYYRSAQFDSAIIGARKLVQKYPDDPKAEKALYDIGWAYKELDNLKKSNEAFLELIDKYPKTEFLPRAIYQLGQNNFDQKNYDKSIEFWADLNDQFKPEAFKDKDWENVQLKGVKERQIFEATAGRETDETILELVAKSQVKIGDAYREKGEFYKAIESYKKVVNTYTLLPVLLEVSYVKMADYTLKEKGIDSTRIVYQNAIDANFSNRQLQAKMQYKIAETYQNQNMFDKAAEEYEFYIKGYQDVAQQIEFGVDQAEYSIVAMYYNAKEYNLAINWADSLLKNYPYSDVISGALFLKGLSLNSNEKYAEARDVFQTIINNYSDSPDAGNAKIQIGFSFLQEKKYNEALTQYLDALTQYPDKIDSSQAYFDLINIYYELNRYDEAITAYDKVEFGSSYFAAAFGKVSKIYALRAEYNKANEFLNAILERSKSVDSVYYQPDVYFAQADLYISQNDYKTAVEYLTKVIDDSSADESKNQIKLQSRYARGVLNYQLEYYNQS